ncbi:Tiparp [Symbiodinium pilosum]|uniref:Tiparp protein n=1 Tax=Symbiodinium pilosum TaxID=2952 RepID=A0A812SIH2_SYMPI|nr:Tiparp [Symbiodinium pilosum]
MDVMEDIPMLNGLAPEEGNVLNKFAKIPLAASELAFIQQIFDSSHKKVYTRDRKGAKVPDRLKVVRAFRVQNLQNWTEFMKKQQSIKQHIETLRQSGNKGVCKNGHELAPLGTSRDNGWGCDGRSEEGGCASKITGFRQTKGMNRFRCERCDFDYCEKCYLLRTGAKVCLNGHPLVPLGTTRDNGWTCDNARLGIGCLRDNKTKGINRYRCEQCDFDLCDLCHQKHIGHVNNSIENLKTSSMESMELHSEGSDPETNTVWLFHGTNDEAAELITKGDFLVDKAGSNAGTLYGRGIYMAESCSKSDEYSAENSEGLRCMLICRAVLGNVLYSDEVAPNVDSLVRQCRNGNYHSLLGDREKCRGTFREFIVYDDDQVYPEIAVWYQRLYDG